MDRTSAVLDEKWGPAFLSMPECDAAFSKVVGGQFQGHFVARQDADAISAQSARQMGQDHAFVLELHTEQPARKLLQNSAGYFDAVLFAHKPPGSEMAGGVPAEKTPRAYVC